MEKIKKISIITAITLVATLVIALCVQAFADGKTELPDENTPIYNIWQFPEEDDVSAGFTLDYDNRYSLNGLSGYFKSNDDISMSNISRIPVGCLDSSEGGFALTQTFYNAVIEGYEFGYPVLSKNTSGNINYHNTGFAFRCNQQTYSIFFRSADYSSDACSIDIIVGFSRYRYIGNNVTELYNDFKECGYVKCELFQEKIYKNEYLFGFKFSTENKSISYNNINTGDITDESVLYYCPVVSSHNEDKVYSISDLMVAVNSTPLENFEDKVLFSLCTGSYTSTAEHGESYYSLFLNVTIGSEYFNDIYWNYRNNVTDILDKYVPQM